MGPAIFYSLLIIVVSFLPVFLLEAQEGRMFRPLAWTNTLAVGFSSLLAITAVPMLMVLFIRRRLKPESANPISRFTQRLYLPVLRWALRHRKTTIALNLLFLAVTIPLSLRLGSQFMPPLYEGSALYMPTALPGISETSAARTPAGTGPHPAHLPRGPQRLRHGRALEQRHRQRPLQHV